MKDGRTALKSSRASTTLFRHDNNFFPLFFSSCLRASISNVFNMVALPTAFLSAEGALQLFCLVETHKSQSMKIVDAEETLADFIKPKQCVHPKMLFILAT